MRILGVGGQTGPASATRRAPNEAHAPDQPETGSRALSRPRLRARERRV